MSGFVTHDHFDVDFFRERGVPFEFFDADEPQSAHYVFHPNEEQLDEWDSAKKQYTEAVLAEMAGCTVRELHEVLHRPMRRPEE